MNIYIELTKKFNAGKLRTIISSGQAAVLHHIAIMSKDGDWILKEDAERRKLIHINEDRLKKYIDAADKWLITWPKVQEEITGLNLMEADRVIMDRANGVFANLG